MNEWADAAFLSTSSILWFIYIILETTFSLAFPQPAYYSGLQNGPGGRNLQQQKRNVTRMISLILAEKIFSLFLIMFMGYAVVHWGLLHAENSKTLSLISLDMVGSAIGPISMIILGMLMAGMNFKKILGYRRLWLVTALRLVGIPLAAVALLKLSGLAHLVPDGQTILLVSLLATCTPSASTITQMAQIYGKDADYASAINVVTTLLCIFTMPLMVALYQL